jgi:hypothetical protein
LPESRESLGKIGIFLARNPIFLACNPIFLARFLIFLNGFPIFLNGFPTFVNGFLLSATPFCFPQCLSAFRNAFLLFETAFRFSSTAFQVSSMAFRFTRNPRKSIYSGKYMKDCFSSFVFPATCSPSFVLHLPQHTPVVHLCFQQCTKPKLKYNLSRLYLNCPH